MRKTTGLLISLLLFAAGAQAQVGGGVVSRVASRFAQYTFANKPTAPAVGTRITITDCLTTACATGGGTVRADFRWTGSAWEIIAAVGGSSGVSALDDLSDVTAPTPSNADIFTYDTATGKWINAAVSYEFSDGVFKVCDNADATKCLAFESSTVGTGTTKTVAVVDAAMSIPSTATYGDLRVRTCEIVVGDPGAASAVLVDDNDTLGVCKNEGALTETIAAVSCYAPSGSPTVTPILTAGGAILSGALTCNTTEGGAAGSLSGTPTLAAGKTINGNITTAGGVAKYLVIYIKLTVPTT